TPAMTFGSDVFRCVISGSHQRGGETVEMGDCRFQAAGVPWEAVVAGPDGLDEVIVVGDRSGRHAVVEGDEYGCADCIEELIAGLLPELPSLARLDVRPVVDDTVRPELLAV